MRQVGTLLVALALPVLIGIWFVDRLVGDQLRADERARRAEGHATTWNTNPHP